MFLVAITGGIATGKSTVSQVFKENGVPVIDADLIAREIVERGKPAYKQIIHTFGDGVLNEYKEIDRDVLGKMIFSDIDLRRKLNEITHPIIHKTIIYQVFCEFAKGRNYVVMDLPLLFETGILIDFIHKIITVTCDPEIQIERVMKRNSLNEDDAKKRIASQMPLEKKCEKSQFVIENSGSLENTQMEASNILKILNASKHHWRIRIYMLIAIFTIITVIYWLNSLFNFLPKFGGNN